MPGERRLTGFLRQAGLALALTGVVIVSSIVLVRYVNRDRAMTTAVAWALESLNEIPDDLLMTAFSAADFKSAVTEFEEGIRTRRIPVDSVRAFYAAYALCARDGKWNRTEILRMGTFIGLSESPRGDTEVRLPSGGPPDSSDGEEQ